MIAFTVHVLVTAVAFWLVSRLLSGWQIKSPRTAVVIAVLYAVLTALMWRAMRWLAVLIGLHAAMGSSLVTGILVGGLAALVLSFLSTVLAVVIVDRALEDFSIGTKLDVVAGCVLLAVVQMILRWALGLPMLRLG